MSHLADDAAQQPRSRRRGQVSAPDDSAGQHAETPAVFVPGYDGERARQRDAQPGSQPYPSGSAGWYGSTAGGEAGKGPVRGYPPVPGQPPPMYPPGQFSAWNRRSAAAHGAPQRPGSGPDDARTNPGAAPNGPRGTRYYGSESGADTDPGYSVLAVSDPAADVTSTQTWKAVAEGRATGTWTMPSAPERGSRSRGTGAPGTQPPSLPRREPGSHRHAASVGRNGVRDGARPGSAGPAATVRPAGRGPAVSDRPPEPAAPPPPGRPASMRRAIGRRGQPTAQIATSNAPAAAPPAAAPGGTRGRGRAQSGPHGSPRKRHGRASVVMAMAGALLLVAAAATALYFGVLRSPGKSHPPATLPGKQATARSASPSPSPTLGPYGHMGTRAQDPEPLTIAQLYPKTFAGSGGTVTRTADKISGNCGSAVVGSGLQSALSSAGCDQAARATYIAPKRGAMGTIGVLNLRSASAAKRAARAAGAGNFIAQVPGRRGPTSKIGQGAGGEEEFSAKGHYLILIWAELTDLRKPRTKVQKHELVAFMNDLLTKTANVSLTNRMLTGRP